MTSTATPAVAADERYLDRVTLKGYCPGFSLWIVVGSDGQVYRMAGDNASAVDTRLFFATSGRITVASIAREGINPGVAEWDALRAPVVEAELWYSIVFMDSDDDEPVSLTGSTSEQIATHLAQWDMGDESEHSPTPGLQAGTDDYVTTHNVGGIDYTLTLNRVLGYAGLSRHAL